MGAHFEGNLHTFWAWCSYTHVEIYIKLWNETWMINSPYEVTLLLN